MNQDKTLTSAVIIQLVLKNMSQSCSQIPRDEYMLCIAGAYMGCVHAFHTKEKTKELFDPAMISVPHPRSILYAMVSRPQRMSAVQLDGTRL
jgi:hypothetical protein